MARIVMLVCEVIQKFESNSYIFRLSVCVAFIVHGSAVTSA